MSEPQATEAPVAVPPDKDAKGLVEAILEQTRYPLGDAASKHLIRLRLGTIQGNAERLAVLLDERDAEREELALMLAKTLGALEGTRAGNPDWNLPSVDAVITEANAALARVKGGE